MRPQGLAIAHGMGRSGGSRDNAREWQRTGSVADGKEVKPSVTIGRCAALLLAPKPMGRPERNGFA